MAKDLAIVLNNGGLNAAVLTAVATQRHRLVLVHLETGGDAAARARAAFEQQVAHFKPFREHAVPAGFLAGVGGAGEPPAGAAAVDPRAPTPVTPRLIELLPHVAVAARYAAHYAAAAVYVGARVGDRADELARATEYVQVWQDLLQTACGQTDMEVLAPLLDLDPWQVVDLGATVSAPFDRTWSCTEPGAEPCWACRGCRAREAAFQQAAKPDPMKVARRG
ncbi:MAG: queC [Phycisphaerales bacterium]|nr:queC [Phycisphaerales bacterium]